MNSEKGSWDRGKAYANWLFSLMGSWDDFDKAVHGVENVLIQIKRWNAAKDVMRYYDLKELLSSAKHYRDILDRIISLLESMVG